MADTTISGLTRQSSIFTRGLIPVSIDGTTVGVPISSILAATGDLGTGFHGLPAGTTADRVGLAPSTGAIRWNTTINNIEYFNGTAWSGDVYSVEYLAVGGGGGGGQYLAGGGGAGGFIENTSSLLAKNTILQIVVGSGGVRDENIGGIDGGNSTITLNTGGVLANAIGGGGGGSATFSTVGRSGGSGGGGPYGTTDPYRLGGLALQPANGGYGFNGGSGIYYAGGGNIAVGGGGGGAGDAGAAGSASGGGIGGIGRISTITGAPIYYAGGGGGGGGFPSDSYPGGVGGQGGGGNGGVASSPGSPGVVNSGGGGGGGGRYTNLGGNGGSGVVILKIPTTNFSNIYTGNPIITTSGNFTILKFINATGSYTI